MVEFNRIVIINGENKLNQSNIPISVGSRKLRSLVAKHIIETGYRTDTNTTFKTLHGNRQGRILRFREALTILKFTDHL